MDSQFIFNQHPRSSGYITSFWQIQGSPAYQTETILPTGLVELIFSFDDPVLYQASRCPEKTSLPRCFINGIYQEPLQLQIPEKQYYFGVTLQPVAVKKLLKVPGGAFANSIINLEEVDPEFTGLWHMLAQAVNFEARIHIIENWTCSRQKEIYPQEAAISAYLHESSRLKSVAELANHFSYSTRQLHRKSQEMFGMSTEAMLAYNRYLKALRFIHQSQEGLTGIAYECDYFDQAHFNREFRCYTGLTPGEYRHQKSHLPGHLYKDVRYVQ